MRRVIKIGGSLLKSSSLAERLSLWQENNETAHTLAIVGGGDLVNAIREIDQVSQLDQIETHWLCVELLRKTCEIMRQRLDWPVIDTAIELQNWIDRPDLRPPISLLQVDTFYSRPQESKKINVQGPQTRSEPVGLPESWDTTTDAIAAVLAKHIGATELILLKSCEVDQRLTLAELAEAEIVDRSFPAAAVGIKSVSIEKLG